MVAPPLFNNVTVTPEIPGSFESNRPLALLSLKTKSPIPEQLDVAFSTTMVGADTHPDEFLEVRLYVPGATLLNVPLVFV